MGHPWPKAIDVSDRMIAEAPPKTARNRDACSALPMCPLRCKWHSKSLGEHLHMHRTANWIDQARRRRAHTEHPEPAALTAPELAERAKRLTQTSQHGR